MRKNSDPFSRLPPSSLLFSFTPSSSNRQILSWAMDAADAYPEAIVTGIDLSPIQPSWVPPNLRFEIADADEPWIFAQNAFSLVHTRIMNSIGVSSWPHFYAEAFACLKPGGWVENQEFDCIIVSDDGSLPEDSPLRQWPEFWEEGIRKVDKTVRCDPQQLERQMQEAGFINTRVIEKKMPIGPLAKRSDAEGIGTLWPSCPLSWRVRHERSGLQRHAWLE